MNFLLNLPFAQVVFVNANSIHKMFFDTLFFKTTRITNKLFYKIIVNFKKINATGGDFKYLEEDIAEQGGNFFVFDTKRKAIKFNPGSFGEKIINITSDPDFDLYYLYNYIIEPLLIIWGAKHNLLYLHSSALFKDGSYVLAAWRHTGKTSSVFNLVGSGMKFMGDDFSVLKEGVVYLYPKSLNIFSYNFDTYPWLYSKLRLSLALRIKMSIYLKNFLYQVSLKTPNPFSKILFRLSELAEVSTNTKVTPEQLDFEIKQSGILKSIFFLTKTNRPSMKSKKMNFDETAHKLLSMTIFEIQDFMNLYLKYKYLNPDRKNLIIEDFNNNFKKTLKKNISASEEVFIHFSRKKDSYLTSEFFIKHK